MKDLIALKYKGTDREKLYITGADDNYMLGDLDKTIEVFRIYDQSYPNGRFPCRRSATVDSLSTRESTTISGKRGPSGRDLNWVSPRSVTQITIVSRTPINIGGAGRLKAELGALLVRIRV